MRHLSDRRVATFFAFVLVSGLCVLLVAVRAWHAGSDGYRFLVWNLVLAWIPFLLALAIYDGWRRARSWALLAPLVVLWLLFLPNAPYLVTDLVHLGTIPGAPLWYDAAMISAFAATGLLLGLASVFLVHAVALRTLGPRLGWAVPVVVLGLCSAGVVVGRFGRLNSSDAIVRPWRFAAFVAHHVTNPLASGRALMLTAAYGAFLVLAYVVLYAVSSLRPDGVPERRR